MYGYLDAHGRLPSDRELQREGCSIIFGAEVASGHPVPPAPSWLRDIFTSSTEIVQQARLCPMEQVAKSRMSQLKINGKSDIFEGCELESRLCRLAAFQNMIGLPMTDFELQREAANLLDRIESDSPNSSQLFTGFLTRLVWMSNTWLAALRDRGRQFPAESIADEKGSRPNLANVHLPNRPANSEHDLGQLQGGIGTPVPSAKASYVPFSPLRRPNHGKGLGDASNTHRARPLPTNQNSFHGSTPFSWALFNNDSNSYRRLARGLSRFVMTTMSSNNPSSHVPTDEELKYQARWIWYGE